MPVEHVADPLPEAVRSLVGDSARLAVLRGLQLSELPPDPDLDRIVALAAELMKAPSGFISVVEEHEQHLRIRYGTDLACAPVDISFCAHTLASGEAMIVEDAARDARFAKNPLVTGPPFIRFYAGCPITVSGQRVATLCVVDAVARARPGRQAIEQMQALAALAGSFLVLKDSSRSGMVARAALAREEKRRGIALEAAALASWAWNVDSHIVECDPLLPELFGMAPATRLHARRLFGAIDRRDLPASRARFRDALVTDGEYFGEYRVAGTHPSRWLAARGRVVERDAEGRPTLLFGVNFDITERKGHEERQRLLLRELNHRVKNTLATVQALASQTVRHSGNARDFLHSFSARLQALGAAHNLLSDREWKGIGIAELVALETKPFQNVAAPRIEIAGEDMMLPPDQAMGLGLILHELGSNATKYGALSQPGGSVRIAWRGETRGGTRSLTLSWRERGGPPVATPETQGFGTILIRRSLAKVLDSHVEHRFAPTGVEVDISMPLTEPESF